MSEGIVVTVHVRSDLIFSCRDLIPAHNDLQV